MGFFNPKNSYFLYYLYFVMFNNRWFLSLSKTLNLFTLILISTIQKIIPIVILSSLNLTNSIIIYVCVITAFVIFYSSLLLLRLIKILALSSINNLLFFLLE